MQFASVGGNHTLKSRARLIVHDVDVWRIVGSVESSMNRVAGGYVVAVLFGCEGLNEDGIGAGMQGNHQVLIAITCPWVEVTRIIPEKFMRWEFR